MGSGRVRLAVVVAIVGRGAVRVGLAATGLCAGYDILHAAMMPVALSLIGKALPCPWLLSKVRNGGRGAASESPQ